MQLYNGKGTCRLQDEMCLSVSALSQLIPILKGPKPSWCGTQTLEGWIYGHRGYNSMSFICHNQLSITCQHTAVNTQMSISKCQSFVSERCSLSTKVKHSPTIILYKRVGQIIRQSLLVDVQRDAESMTLIIIIITRFILIENRWLQDFT